MSAYWRDAADRPLTDAEVDDLVGDATADMSSLDAVERLTAEVRRLRAIEQAAREFIASEDRGPFESAVAVRNLRAALNGGA